MISLKFINGCETMARSGEFIFLGGDRKSFQADDTRRNDVSDF
jgi:hypothetical protein